MTGGEAEPAVAHAGQDIAFRVHGFLGGCCWLVIGDLAIDLCRPCRERERWQQAASVQWCRVAVSGMCLLTFPSPTNPPLHLLPMHMSAPPHVQHNMCGSVCMLLTPPLAHLCSLCRPQCVGGAAGGVGLLPRIQCVQQVSVLMHEVMPGP